MKGFVIRYPSYHFNGRAFIESDSGGDRWGSIGAVISRSHDFPEQAARTPSLQSGWLIFYHVQSPVVLYQPRRRPPPCINARRKCAGYRSLKDGETTKKNRSSLRGHDSQSLEWTTVSISARNQAGSLSLDSALCEKDSFFLKAILFSVAALVNYGGLLSTRRTIIGRTVI